MEGLARLIVAVLRRRGTAGTAQRSGVEVVVLQDKEGRSLVVQKDDWAKILPFIQDGSFNSFLTPLALLDRADSFLYQRVLLTLRGLFPEPFPTSNP